MDIFNGYKINNPDGVLNENFDEWQKPFTGGRSNYVNESSSTSQGEASASDEIYDPDKKRSDNKSAGDANASQSGSSKDVRSSATARSLNALPAVTTAGGGLSVFAGVIASSFVTAALVVAVFVSVLTIRLSLVMADFDRLVVQVTMEGAQDEDFLTPIVAVLEGKNGEHREVDIFRDTYLLTFDGLSPDEEYTIRVRSGEKLFAENTFVTASEPKKSGSITAYTEGDKVYIVAKDVALKAGEFYSVIVKDGEGKTIFGADSDEPNKTFSFTPQNPSDLYITLGIGGEIYSVCRIKMELDQVYDLMNGTWEWTSNTDATVSFAEIHGGEPLVIVANVVEKTTLNPGCETAGEITFTATAEYDGGVYSDDRTVTISALGHDYGSPTFTWTSTDNGYTVTAEFVCTHNAEHKENVTASVATVVTDPTCDDDGFTTYTATVVFGDEEYSDEKVVVDENSALGHDFSQYYEGSEYRPTFVWTEEDNGGYTAVAVFNCKNNSSHTQEIDAEIGVEDGVDCTDGGYIYYYASVLFNDCDYSEEKKVWAEPGHKLMPVFHWINYGETYSVEFHMVCERGDYQDGPNSAELLTTEEKGYTLYTATAVYDNVVYTENKKVVKNTEHPLEVGATFKIGDTIDLNGTVYFSDDYSGAERTSMSGPASIVGVGYESGTQTSYAAVMLQNDQFVRMDDNGWAAGETPEWLFTSSGGDIVGVTISGGSGTEEDPYTLTPVYSVTVTYNANDGVFNTIEGYSVTQYYTDEEVSSGVYAVPIAENPESSGKLFIGWFTDEYATEKFDFENTPITESITLYAGWVSI